MQSAILRYDTFKGYLEDLDLKINKYDTCVANKMINGQQCKVSWYVGDTKISHKDNKVVGMVIKEIEEKFGKMIFQQGK